MPKPTPAQQAYYLRLKKLTPEQIEEAYNRYYNYTAMKLPTQPTMAGLAKHYNVSINAMFRALHKHRLEKATNG